MTIAQIVERSSKDIAGTKPNLRESIGKSALCVVPRIFRKSAGYEPGNISIRRNRK